jgi:hypothetical protein
MSYLEAIITQTHIYICHFTTKKMSQFQIPQHRRWVNRGKVGIIFKPVHSTLQQTWRKAQWLVAWTSEQGYINSCLFVRFYQDQRSIYCLWRPVRRSSSVNSAVMLSGAADWFLVRTTCIYIVPSCTVLLTQCWEQQTMAMRCEWTGVLQVGNSCVINVFFVNLCICLCWCSFNPNTKTTAIRQQLQGVQR